jgi:biotin synthase
MIKDKKLVNDVLAGKALSDKDAYEILTATGSTLTSYFAGAQYIKEKHFSNNAHLCSITNAKSGHCSEDCSFCAQSSHYQTDAPVYALKKPEELLRDAKKANKDGHACYSIVTSGAKIEPGEEFEQIEIALKMIRAETTVTPSVSIGTIDLETAQRLVAAGCKTYHHNLETARSFYPNICTTHPYDDDINTLKYAKKAGLRVCSGGIFGLGESLEQRVELGLTLRELDIDSIPINFLTPISGTPLEGQHQLTPIDCLRVICLFRYLLPTKTITICGGREKNLRDFQSCIFMAGANGMMVGNYLTTSGRNFDMDIQLLKDAEVIVNAEAYNT